MTLEIRRPAEPRNPTFESGLICDHVRIRLPLIGMVLRVLRNDRGDLRVR
jgi:hypothetical protein